MWTWVLPASMIVAAAVIPLLVWYAADAILNSADGELTLQVDDPAAPGYEVLVVASPSHMVLTEDPAGELAGVTILALASNDRGGSALFLAAETLVDAERRLVDVHREDGPEATRLAVAGLMDINVDALSIFDETGWTSITAPAAPIPVDNPVDLVSVGSDGVATIVFPAGNIGIEADQSAAFNGWVNPDEAVMSRVERQMAFWRAWVAVIAASDDEAIVPGELDSGIGRMLRGLSNGPAIIGAVEGEELLLASGEPALRVDLNELRAVVVQMVPFPLPVEPGARPTVRLLDGVGGLDVASNYSAELVSAGAQILIIGNASSFGVEQTEVVYHQARFEAKAQAFAEELGGATVRFEPLKEAVIDVTIIIGEDLDLAVG